MNHAPESAFSACRPISNESARVIMAALRVLAACGDGVLTCLLVQPAAHVLLIGMAMAQVLPMVFKHALCV